MMCKNNVPKEAAGKVFHRLGLSLFVMAAVTALAQILLGTVGAMLAQGGSQIVDSSWFMWLATFVPIYLVGVPLGLLMMKKLPVTEQEEMPLGGRNFLTFLLMCFPLMYGGNLLGTLLSTLLSGGNASNGLFAYALDQSPLKVLVMVILAPLLEEYLFRKQLIDRCARFGEKTAILFSALMFALFHMNLYQFFYAFGLGLVFGYVYTRTRRLRYSAFMHMIVNFMGSVLAPALLSGIGPENLELMTAGQLSEEAIAELLPAMVGFMLYSVILLGLSIWGLILLIIKAPRLVYLPAAQELPKPGKFKTVFCNPGTILFALFCMVICILSLQL